MTLRSEIASLRKAIEKQESSASEVEAPVPLASVSAEDDVDKQTSFDSLLKMVGETIEDLGKDVDTYPRLMALTAFAIGLSLGVAISPRGR